MLDGLKNKDDKFLEIFSKNLKHLRESKGLSQDKLAIECEVAKSTIQRIEWRKLNPTITIAKRISEGLDVDISELFKV